jgi:hypothetical protein
VSARSGGLTPAAAARVAFKRYMLAKLRRRTRGWWAMVNDRPALHLFGPTSDTPSRATGPSVAPPPLERGPMRRRWKAAR